MHNNQGHLSTEKTSSNWDARDVGIGGRQNSRYPAVFLFLFGRVDGDNIRKGSHRTLLPLWIPIEHNLDLDSKNSLKHEKHNSIRKENNKGQLMKKSLE